jgi:hypothetical protein
MTDRSALDERRGIFDGSFTNSTVVGNVEGDFDNRTFSTIIKIMLPEETPDRDAIVRWAEEQLERRKPLIERLQRIEPAAGREQLLAAYTILKHPLGRLPAIKADADLFHYLVNLLAYRFSHDGVHPLLAFAEALARDPLLAEADREALRAWLADARAVWTSDAAALAARGAAVADEVRAMLEADPALLIALEPDDEDETRTRLRLRAWVWLSPGWTERIARHLSDSYTTDELRARLHEVYREALLYTAKHSARMTVEFFLPRTKLSTPVQEWPVLVGLDEDEEVWLCSLHRVMVRPHERNFLPSDAAEAVRSTWRSKWELLCAAKGGLFFKPEQVDIFQRDAALFRLLVEATVIGYAETLPLPAGVDHPRKILKRVIDAGLPVSIWMHGEGDLPASAYKDLDALAAIEKLAKLRDRVRELHAAAGAAAVLGQPPPPLGASLVLLWDDPARLPPQHELFVSPAQP